MHIIKCETPSTTTSDDSNCTECQKRRENNSNKSLGFVNERFVLPALVTQCRRIVYWSRQYVPALVRPTHMVMTLMKSLSPEVYFMCTKQMNKVVLIVV